MRDKNDPHMSKRYGMFWWKYGIPYVTIIILFIWVINLQNSVDGLHTGMSNQYSTWEGVNEDLLKIAALGESMQDIKVIDTNLDIFDIKDEIMWECVAWYGSCGNFILDNETGMYVPEGYLEYAECEGACKSYNLRRITVLPTINMQSPSEE